MAFFSKVKQFFGAGTLKVELSAPPQVAKATGHFPGRIALTALSDQHVLDVQLM
jgi:hypothetical protein